MVSLWPWKGEDNSPASFAKSLEALAAKIVRTQAQLTSLQQRSRRFKALWTLYTSFAYLLCVVILFLVVGWKNWTALEYTAVAGSPLIVWIIRTAITKYYTFRVESVTQRLEDQQEERAKTIGKLKAATKYDSTQELLERYGGEKPKPKPKKETTGTPSKSPKNAQKPAHGRTSMGPPPATANIVRPGQISSQPSTPQPLQRSPPTYIASSPISPPGPSGHAEFAPNAFSAPPQYAQSGEMVAEGHWYDRVLDLLLGEDETLPRNRMALICQNCRLVNGQAPPGTRTLAELGKWKCFGCGTMNGEDDEAAKVVQEMKQRIGEPGNQTTIESEEAATEAESRGDDDDGSNEEQVVKDDDAEKDVEDEVAEDSASDTVEVRPKRGRPKGSRKKA